MILELGIVRLCNYRRFSILIKYLSLEDAEENVESSGRSLQQCGPLWEEGGSGTRLFGNQGLNEGRTENNKERASPSEENKTNKNQLPKVWKMGSQGQVVGGCDSVGGCGSLELILVRHCFLMFLK